MAAQGPNGTKININGGVVVRPAPFKPGSNPYSR